MYIHYGMSNVVLVLQTHPSAFCQLGDHHNDSCLLLPDHAPEVCGCTCERALRRNVGPGLLVALHTANIWYQ